MTICVIFTAVSTIEGTSHKTSGYGVVPWGFTRAPRETTIIEDVDQESEGKDSWHVQKRSSFTKEQINEHNAAYHRKSSVNLPSWQEGQESVFMQPESTPVKAMSLPLKHESMYVARPALPSENTKTVPVFDDIIMDENVNFALRYSTRIKDVKKEWYERRNSGTSSMITEKSIILPSSSNDASRNNSRRVSITDIAETQILDINSNNNVLSPFNSFGTSTKTGSYADGMMISPVSEMSLPVSPSDSVKM
jgi:hypothetical protein